MSRKITIRLGAEDHASSVLRAVMKSMGDFTSSTVEATHKAVESFRFRAMAMKDYLLQESGAFERAHRSALTHYETLEQINKRIDAPKAAARAQEELNKSIERYNRLLQEAAYARKAAYAKKHYYNAFDPDTFKNLDKLHGVDEAVPKSFVERMKEMTASAKKAWPALMMVNRAMGEGKGVTAGFAQALMGVAGMFMAFGPAGAIIGAAQAGIDALAGRWKARADEMVETAKKLRLKTAEALASKKETLLDVYEKRISGAAQRADSRAERIDDVIKHQADEAAAGRRAVEAEYAEEIQRMKALAAHDKAESDESDKQRVEAAWRYEIAKKEVELKRRVAEQERADEEAALAAAEDKLAITRQNVKELNAVAVEAARKAAVVEDAFGGDSKDKAYVKQFQDIAKAAMKRAEDEQKRAERQEKAVSIMYQDMETNDQKRRAAELESAADVDEAKSAYITSEEQRERRILEAEIAAAKERERLDREAHQRRMAYLRKEIDAQKEATAPLKTVAAAAKSEFDRAFAMYRDPSRAAAEIGEEKAYQKDLDRLHRDARRYGGKWRIDELSRLMSAGDTQGVTTTLNEWRRSKSFTPEVEAMVRASAAEKTKTSAEDELRKIEKNTSGLAAKLDELLRMKE